MTSLKETVARKVQEAVEAMPYPWAASYDGQDTLRSFFEDTWQGRHADEVFKAASEVATQAAITALFDWMAEPSEAMIDRFVSRALQVSVEGEGGWSNYAREQWKTMLEAARKEALE